MSVLNRIPSSWDTTKLFLACSSCYKWTSLPQRLCENKHLICSSCSDRTCPVNVNGETCGLSFIEAPMDMHHYVYNENILPCPYEARGCEIAMFGREIESHLANDCYYKSLRKCIVTGCGERNIKSEDYGKHLKEYHAVHDVKQREMGILIVFEDEQTDVYGERAKCILMLDCYGVKFAVFFGEYGDRIVLWVAVFEEKKIGNKYLAKITLRDTCSEQGKEPNCIEPTKVFEFPVQSLHSAASVVQIDESQECTGISSNILRSKYLEPNNFERKFCRAEITIEELQ